MDSVSCEDFSFPMIQAMDFTVADPPIAAGAKGAEGSPYVAEPETCFDEGPPELWRAVGPSGYRALAPPEAPALEPQ